MLNKIHPIIKLGGSLTVVLTTHLKELGVKHGDFVMIKDGYNKETKTKIITIQKVDNDES